MLIIASFEYYFSLICCFLTHYIQTAMDPSSCTEGSPRKRMRGRRGRWCCHSVASRRNTSTLLLQISLASAMLDDAAAFTTTASCSSAGTTLGSSEVQPLVLCCLNDVAINKIPYREIIQSLVELNVPDCGCCYCARGGCLESKANIFGPFFLEYNTGLHSVSI